MPDWTVVVPVKGTAAAKSRFGGTAGYRAELAEAMALDTVEAVRRARLVTRVIVVTDHNAAAFESLGAEVVAEGGSTGLLAAIGAGLSHAGDAPAAVLLGDIPALDPAELDAALTAAAEFSRAMVPDADGTGTVLTTALAGADHQLKFGAGSAAAHRAAGYVALDLPADSGLRRDVDLPEQLAAIPSGRLGPRTRVVALG